VIGTTLLLTSLAASQGQAVELVLPHEPGLISAAVEWDGRTAAFASEGSQWLALIGVDLEAMPGIHVAKIVVHFADDRTETREQEIEVAAGTFPTTHLEVEPRYVELSPEDAARSAREDRAIAAIYATTTPERLWQEPFAAPLEGVGGGRNFGHRRVFNGAPRAPHSGTDLTATTGTPVRAANRGRVVLSQDLFFSGNAVFLDHGLGVYSVYLHLSEIQVREGDIVEQGAIVGLAGATGRVTGPHLHWGVRVLGARVDPFTLLSLGGE
jgi:murein DD-endopeptidase MepM/ murein hydrolase activator NlpD